MQQIDLTWKENLYSKCVSILEEKVKDLEAQQWVLRLDLSSTSKSSAGDKYETNRAMIHLEQERIGALFSEAKKQEQYLRQVDISIKESIEVGALIETTKGLFFIAIAMGEIEFNGREVFVISPLAPLAKALISAKRNRNHIEFNSRTYNILGVF